MNVCKQVYHRVSTGRPIAAFAGLHSTDAVGDRFPRVGLSVGLPHGQLVFTAFNCSLGNDMAVDPRGDCCSLGCLFAVNDSLSGVEVGWKLRGG